MSNTDRLEVVLTRLFQERERRKLTQDEVAAWIGVTRQMVSNWENNRGSPSISQLAAWANGYGWELIVELATDGPSEPPVDDFRAIVGTPSNGRNDQGLRRAAGAIAVGIASAACK